MNKLFVYGTLKKNESNHRLLKDEKYLGICKTQDKYNLVFDRLPFLSEYPQTEQIEGELYEVNDVKLKELDIFEGHPFLYERKIIKVLFDNNVIECYCYIYND